MRTFGSLVRARRGEKGLSVCELAAASHVSRQYLYRIESGAALPRPDTIWILQRNLELQTGEWVEAYLASSPQCPAILRLAEDLMNQGDFGDSNTLLDAARRLSCRRTNGRFLGQIARLRGIWAYRRGRFWSACRAFEQMERAFSHSPASLLHARATYNYALALAKTGRVGAALLQYDSAIRAFSSLHKMQRSHGVVYLAKGNLLLDIRSYAEALECYEKAAFLLRGDPLGIEALLGQAICSVAVGRDLTQAVLSLKRLLKRSLEPITGVRIAHNTAVILRQEGRIHEASHFAEMAHTRSLSGEIPVAIRASVLCELALCRLECGDAESAREALVDFHNISGQVDAQDSASAALLSLVLGDRSGDRIPATLDDDYEHRALRALQLLLESRRGLPEIVTFEASAGRVSSGAQAYDGLS